MFLCVFGCLCKLLGHICLCPGLLEFRIFSLSFSLWLYSWYVTSLEAYIWPCSACSWLPESLYFPLSCTLVSLYFALPWIPKSIYFPKSLVPPLLNTLIAYLLPLPLTTLTPIFPPVLCAHIFPCPLNPYSPGCQESSHKICCPAGTQLLLTLLPFRTMDVIQQNTFLAPFHNS